MADNPMTLERIAKFREMQLPPLSQGGPLYSDYMALCDLAEAALKQPRTQWQPRITPDEAQELFCAVLCESLSDSDMFIARLRELGIDVIEPPEASREARMAADGITEEDLAETMPPKPEDAR